LEPWTFVHVADMQPGSPRSYRYNPSLMANWREAKRQIAAIQPDLVLVGGDLTRDGSLHLFELEEMKRELDELGCPYYAVPGNMDTGNKHTRVEGNHRAPDQCSDLDLNVTSEQLRQYVSVFGPLWWSVEHKGVRFSGFTDMIVNSGLPEESEFWKWAEEQAARPRAGRHVWITHSPLFIDHPDEPNWDVADCAHYRDWYFSIDQPGRGRLMEMLKATGAELVISGHVHCRHSTVVDGIRFVVSPSTAFYQKMDRWEDQDLTLGFLRYDVGPEGIRETFVPLEKTYDLPGKYGPGGHPAPHARDYSLAQEKTQ
jgi:predicted phosphodiesterase